MTLRAVLSRVALLHHVTPPAPTVIEQKRTAFQGVTPRYRITQPTTSRYRLVPRFVQIEAWLKTYDVSTRIGQLGVDPSPQHASADAKG